MIPYFHDHGNMQTDRALESFYALSQETRLKVFKLLIEYGTKGLAPTKIAQEVGVPVNTLSFHLAHLTNVGLIDFKREGRSLIYSANCAVVDDLVGFIKENCCVRRRKK